MHKSLPSRSRSRSRRRAASTNLTQFIKKTYPNKTPIAVITGISKLYCKKKAVTKESKILKRIAESNTHVNTAKFIQLLSTTQVQHKKVNSINDDTVKKIYQGFCNPEGKLSFEYLMKMGLQSGFHVSQKIAKGIIKKYGQRKQFVNLQDCQRVIRRRNQNINNRKLSPRISPRSNKVNQK